MDRVRMAILLLYLACNLSPFFHSVYPSDIETLNITHTEMTAAELKKVDELLERPYMNAQLKRELTHLKTRKLKAEIENIYKCSIDYLIKDYIPQKIRSVDEPFNAILNGIHGERVDDIFEF